MMREASMFVVKGWAWSGEALATKAASRNPKRATRVEVIEVFISGGGVQ
jgi:hypothetical protein